MRLTRDESFRLRDQFEDFIESLVGEDVITHRGPDLFTVEILRRRKRIQTYKAKRNEPIPDETG